MKYIILASLMLTCFNGFSQQVVTISINQPGIENCLATNAEINLSDYICKIYPNPANSKLTVELNQSPENKTVNIRLLNVLGQTMLLWDETTTNGKLKKELDVSGIPNGIYFLKINGSEFKTSEKILVTGKK